MRKFGKMHENDIICCIKNDEGNMIFVETQVEMLSNAIM